LDPETLKICALQEAKVLTPSDVELTDGSATDDQSKLDALLPFVVWDFTCRSEYFHYSGNSTRDDERCMMLSTCWRASITAMKILLVRESKRKTRRTEDEGQTADAWR